MGGVASAPSASMTSMEAIAATMKLLTQRLDYLDARIAECEAQKARGDAGAGGDARCASYTEQRFKIWGAWTVLQGQWAKLAIPVMRAGIEELRASAAVH
jgi:hypothetical protein